jgi:hypothetical protein
MAPRKHEHGPPMDLVNMRRQGVRSLIAYSLDSLWLAGATVDGGGHEGAKIMLTNNHTNPRTSANTSVCATHQRTPNREVY